MNDRSRAAGKTAPKDALLILGVAFATYLVLRSRFYIGDGIRYLPAMTSPTVPHDGGNGHFLWPYVGWLACRVCAILGVPISAGDGPVNTGAIGLIQGVNAFAAGLGLALLYGWLRDVASRRAALLGVVLTAFSHAFLLHATDMTEPMAAFAPMMLGLWLLNRAPDRIWARFLVGGLIGVASDFYEIALVAVAPAVWIAGLPTPRSPADHVPRLPRFVRMAIEIGGASVATRLALMATIRFATKDSLGVSNESGVAGLALFGSLNPKHFAAGIFGFANSLAELPVSGGMSLLFHEAPRDLVTTLATTFLAVAFLAGLSVRLARSREQLAAQGRWPDLVAAAGWFALVACAACYWSPLYEKFWLFASAPLAMAVALGIEPKGNGAADADPAPTERRWPLFLGPAAVLLLLSVATGAIPRRFGHNKDVDVATRLAVRLKANDLLVTPGWDAPSAYLRAILKRPMSCFDLTDETIALSFHSAELAERLAAQVEAARARGGNLYFLGLLKDSPADWNLFFGSRLALPFDTLAPYRPGAVVVDTFATDPPQVLYEVPP